MLNFDFYNPTQILFGKGRIADLNKAIPAEAHVLMLYGGGSIKQNGVYDEVIAALGTRQVTAVFRISELQHLIGVAVEQHQRIRSVHFPDASGGIPTRGDEQIAAGLPCQ